MATLFKHFNFQLLYKEYLRYIIQIKNTDSIICHTSDL